MGLRQPQKECEGLYTAGLLAALVRAGVHFRIHVQKIPQKPHFLTVGFSLILRKIIKMRLTIPASGVIMKATKKRILQGRVKFPIGGTVRERFYADPV